MKKEVFSYLSTYSFDPLKINRLIVSSFLYQKDIKIVKNKFIKNLLIQRKDADFEALKEFNTLQILDNFEQLIELFEFVISPEEKIVNGAIYTPKYIRDYIINESLRSNKKERENIKICDPACGCSAFLLSCAKLLNNVTGRPFSEIFRNQLFGLDIEEFSIERSKILLSLLAISEGEDEESFDFNLFKGNALSFDWSDYPSDFSGFDIVLGNPPYVCSRNMDQESLDLIDNWEVTKSGHPDLYIPFFQLGFESLKADGILGFITVNTFIKSVNGRSLREYFSRNKVDLKIINFGGEQIFKNRSTYTCICFLKNSAGKIKYKKATPDSIESIKDSMFISYEYDTLHDHDGWNLVDSKDQLEYVNKIEAVGRPFKDVYTTRNGIATLKNDIYKFFPFGEDDRYFLLKTKNGSVYKIEKDICRDIVNPNKARSEEDILVNNEKIIFPYTQSEREILILEEQVFQELYPHTYQYLCGNREILSTRDKGQREYEKWYAYGRRQSLDINSYKLFFPHLSERPTFTISKDKKLLFYSGIAVVSDSLRELRVLKRIMESDIFFGYIKSITKDYSSGYISMSKNYIKNFGICELSEEEKDLLLESSDPERLLRRYYGLSKPDELIEDDLTRVAEPNKQNYG
ncbi:N-6 DNA methylase [Cyclobacterium sp.]|uniref:HsdM family class I SAM-dependent methyltransferase n=1 Tax=Cyclobacterium sp. TaxID=1966343 RepID=UPI0019C9504C|nr:N-6 DNA methylase [Cyclobacterium sp.]MBD3628287.1 N-6 DNA methylase [Cyclobacterium sp.]